MTELNPRDLGESVAILCAHDDDGILGCAGLLQKLKAKKTAIILTDGRWGYSNLKQKRHITDIRSREAENAYDLLDTDVNFLEFPDSSLRQYECMQTCCGNDGAYLKVIEALREANATSLFIQHPNDWHEDHLAAYRIGMYCARQASEPLALDLGKPTQPLKVFLYQVDPKRPLAECTHFVSLTQQETELKEEALKAFKSQGNILKSLVLETLPKRELYQMLKL